MQQKQPFKNLEIPGGGGGTKIHPGTEIPRGCGGGGRKNLLWRYGHFLELHIVK